MQEIGKILKENRINQNKSIEDISNITKMNINIITNIEDGNIDYFSNDLGYLRYYVRSYVSALNIEIENLEETLNEATLEYTQSINVLEQEKIDQINEQVRSKKINLNLNQDGLKKAKKVDWTLISLVIIVACIGAFLIYSLVSNAINKPKDDNNKPDVVETDDGKEENGKEDDGKEPDVIEPEVKDEVKVTMKESNNVELVDWLDETEIKVVYKRETWVQMSVNGVVVILPDTEVSSKTYQIDETLIIKDHYLLNGEEVKFKEGDIISIRFGVMANNEFYINDKNIPLEPEVAGNENPMDLIFTFGKKGN